MDTDVMFSSKSGEWGTPLDFFAVLNERFGPFDLDPATSAGNPLGVPDFMFLPERDGLAVNWHGRVFVNPPYGRGIGKWIEKAAHEVACERASRVVMLLPARTDTKWFHDLIYTNPRARVIFLRGRLTFVGAPAPAPFPSMIVVFEQEL